MSTIDDIEASRILVAALNEAGYPAEIRDGTGVNAPPGIPCRVVWKAASLARQARGHPVETFHEWHAHQRFSNCDCGWGER